MRIEFKAYGGTGALIARSFVTLLALNACDVATDGHNSDICVLYQLDYDESTPSSRRQTEASYLKLCVEHYQNLHKRGLKFLAPIRLAQDTHTLKQIREKAYDDLRGDFSLKSLFCKGPHNDEIYELLSAAFTANDNTLVEEIERSNAEGCYGDLAVNGFISERINSTKAFAKSGIYDALGSSLGTGAVVFYAGSTDGGTANTMIDKDIRSLLHYLAEDCNESVGPNRKFKLYGLRTTPYSYFNSSKGEELDKAVTATILRDKFQMSRGVLKKIDHQNQMASNAAIDRYSYYQIASDKNYWLDGLFLAGSDTLDLTDDVARKDGQFHPSHLVEFTLAQQAMNAIANRMPSVGAETPHLFGYNDGGSDAKHITLEGYFDKVVISYQFEIYDTMGDQPVNVEFYKYVRAFMLTLVTIKAKMIPDFREYSYRQKNRYRYIYDLFRANNDEVDVVIEKTVHEFEKFLEEVRFIVMTFVNIMDCSKFGHPDRYVDLVESEIRYIYESDNFYKPIEMPAGNNLSIDDEETLSTIEISQYPSFDLVDDMHNFPYHEGGIFGKGAYMKHENKFDEELRGANNDESAYNVANDYIKRTFETYLAKIL